MVRENVTPLWAHVGYPSLEPKWGMVSQREIEVLLQKWTKGAGQYTWRLLPVMAHLRPALQQRMIINSAQNVKETKNYLKVLESNQKQAVTGKDFIPRRKERHW